jgi:hypothetical protein
MDKTRAFEPAAGDLLPGILLSPALLALKHVLHEAKCGFHRSDITRVEATWEWLDADTTAHGFVFALSDGRRVYVRRVASFPDETDDDVRVLPIEDERYPLLEGVDFSWSEDVADMNRLQKFLSA